MSNDIDKPREIDKVLQPNVGREFLVGLVKHLRSNSSFEKEKKMNSVRLTKPHQASMEKWATLRLIGISVVPAPGAGILAHFSLQVVCDQKDLVLHIAFQAKEIAEQEFNCQAQLLQPVDPSCEYWKRVLFTRHIPKPPIQSERELLLSTAHTLLAAEKRGKRSYLAEVEDLVTHTQLTHNRH